MMKKKKIYLLFDNSVHEYTIVKKYKKNGNIKYTLSLSHGEQWNENAKGLKQVSILIKNVDTVDEVFVIKDLFNETPYDKIHLLKVLLNFITRNFNEGKYKIIKTKKIKY